MHKPCTTCAPIPYYILYEALPQVQKVKMEMEHNAEPVGMDRSIRTPATYSTDMNAVPPSMTKFSKGKLEETAPLKKGIEFLCALFEDGTCYESEYPNMISDL